MNASTDPRVGRSRRAILDAAIELLLVQPSASLSDIAQKAGVGRATLYRHFDTREQLVLELVTESLAITEQVLRPILDAGLDARETLEQTLPAAMRVADRYHFLLLLWTIGDSHPKVTRIYAQLLEELSALIERGKREKAIDPELSTDWIVALIDSLVYAGWWGIQTQGLSAQQAGEHAARVLFDGISNR